jgi:two-component system phosphate regulon response regulator PhoB
MPDVLLIDDDPSVADMACGILEEYGYSAAWAPTADAGLRMARASPPRLILLDWMLPGKRSGMDIATTLHSQPETCAIPIVLLTAIDHPYERGARADVTAVITKPFRIGPFLQTIDKYILEAPDGR